MLLERMAAIEPESSLLFNLWMLGNAQDVPVRILEPRNPRSGGCGPDSQLILRHVLVAFEPDSGRFKLPGGCSDVWNLPPENRARGRPKLLRYSEAEHDAVCVEHEGERRLLRQQAQTECAAVELLGALYVDDGYKSDRVVSAEAFGLGHREHYELISQVA